MATKNQLKNRALRRVACEYAAPENHFDRDAELLCVASAARHGANDDEIRYAVYTGINARGNGYGPDSPIVVWSKGRDFGTEGDWEQITRNAADP